MPSWNPSQYLQFSNERLRPAMDLLANITIENPEKVVDLGCGTGTSTNLLKNRWPNANIIGIDSSDDMLIKAHETDQSITWLKADIQTWDPSDNVDVLFSNAALHWLDDHDKLFPNLFSYVKKGGILAIQMPNNFCAPTHTAISETIKEGPWKDDLINRLREKPVHDPQEYYDILETLSTQINIWETTYYQILEGKNPVVEWTKGSALRPFLDLLDENEKKSFLQAYTSKIQKTYPKQNNGKTILPFSRLFIIVVK